MPVSPAVLVECVQIADSISLHLEAEKIDQIFGVQITRLG